MPGGRLGACTGALGAHRRARRHRSRKEHALSVRHRHRLVDQRLTFSRQFLELLEAQLAVELALGGQFLRVHAQRSGEFALRDHGCPADDDPCPSTSTGAARLALHGVEPAADGDSSGEPGARHRRRRRQLAGRPASCRAGYRRNPAALSFLDVTDLEQLAAESQRLVNRALQLSRARIAAGSRPQPDVIEPDRT
jgi:hypothetical protein